MFVTNKTKNKPKNILQMLILHDQPVFVISLSINISSLWPFFENREDAVLLFTAYTERFYNRIAKDGIGLSIVLKNRFKGDLLFEVLNSGFCSEFILKNIPEEKLLKQWLNLNPEALVFSSLACFEEILPQFRTYRTPKPLATDFRDIIRPNIRAKVIIEPNVETIKACSLVGCDEVIFKALPLDADHIEQYSYMSRIAVDLGMNVGIEEGFNLAELERVIREVPYVNTVYLGRMFFSMAIFDGLEKTLNTYLELIQKYR